MRALVTGAGGAFGGAVAAALRDRGWTVITTDVVGAVDVVADVSDDSCVARLRAAADDGLDVLIYSAGVGPPGDVGEPPTDAVRRTLEVNLLGAWRAVGAVMPALLTSRGRIVLVASGLAYVPLPFAGAYAVSKRALSAYADQLRAEYGSHVSVTTVYPGYVATPIHDAGAAAGLSFDGRVHAESVEVVVRKILDVVEARTPPRDVGTSWRTSAALWAGRHLPRTTDRLVAARVRQLVRRGAFDGSPLSAGLRKRLGRRD
jgi:NAD(P)-dependent dehydrogenase (short-subunit alcohol dehydrogenase family)